MQFTCTVLCSLVVASTALAQSEADVEFEVPPHDAGDANQLSNMGKAAEARGANVLPTIFVNEPNLAGIPAELKGGISAAIAGAAVDEGLSVLTKTDAVELLTSAQNTVALGGEADGDALAELGRRVGAEHLLATDISSIDGDVVVQLRLLNTRNAEVLSRRESRASEHGGELMTAVEVGTRLVIAPVFGHIKGKLAISTSEEGANVMVDGELVGISPLSSALELPGGSHLLSVTKDSFIRHQERVRIEADDVVKRMVRLRPSEEFIEDYESRNRLYRTVAWSSSGAAVAMFVGAITTGVLKSVQDSETVRLADTFNSLPAAERTPSLASITQDRINGSESASSNLGTAFVTLGVFSLVTGATSAYFWLFGDDPDRYADFSAGN